MIGNYIGAPIGGVVVSSGAINEATASAAGTGVATGIGASTAASVGVASGTGAASGVGSTSVIVTKTIGSTGVFSTPRLWALSAPVDLTTAEKSLAGTFAVAAFQQTEDLTFVGSGATGRFLDTDSTGPGTGTYIVYGITTGNPAASDVVTGASSGATCVLSSSTPVGVGVVWRGECQNQEFSSTEIISINGNTTSESAYLELTTVAGASFRDHADAQTNALRYNASNGAAIVRTDAGGTTFSIGSNFTRISNLQIAATATNADAIFVNGASTVVRIDNCIIEGTETTGVSSSGVLTACSSIVSNCVIVLRATGADHIIGTGTGSPKFYNCSIVAPDDLATAPVSIFLSGTSGTVTVQNCGLFAGDSTKAIKAGSATFNFTTCYSDISGTSGVTQCTYSSEYQNVNDSTRDFRIKFGAAQYDTGTTDLAHADEDIVGTSRPQGSAYDVGAWELVPVATGVGSASGTGVATGVGRSTAASTAASTGAGVAAGIGASTAASTAASAGTGTATGIGISTAAATAAASGTGAAAAVGEAVPVTEGAGAAAGTGVATGVGISTAASTAASAGTGTATGVGISIAAATASAAGAGTAAAIGIGINAGAGAATGTGVATGIGESTAASAGAAVGAGTAAGIGSSTAASIAAASGAGVGTGIGASTAASVGDASGAGVAAAVGTGINASVGAAAGTGDTLGVGTSIAASIGAASGAGTAAVIGESTAASIAAATGTGDASGIGISTAAAAAAAAGTGAASGVGFSIAAVLADASGQSIVIGIGASTAAAVGVASGAGVPIIIGDYEYQPITDTDILQLPVNCVLAGEQLIKDGWREWNVPQSRRTEKTRVMRSATQKLSGNKPGFTTKTDSRGYD